jgi:Ser/Thr protein kinase RdoA (MazF antagonist)
MYREKPYVIFECIEGEQIDSLNVDQKRQIIQKAAELQRITRMYHPRYTTQRWNYSPQLCRTLGQEAAKKINTREAQEKLAWLEKELSLLRLPMTLPKGICHCDFHPSNILFKNGELKALLDFDDANYTYLTYDLATLIDPFLPSFNWQTWERFEKEACVFDFREARETVLEYGKYRPLSHNEKRHLFDVYKLSILFDSIWYYARGNGKDFYEKRKNDHLNGLGRERFYGEIFANG